jgi:hypothetical protein
MAAEEMYSDDKSQLHATLQNRQNKKKCYNKIDKTKKYYKIDKNK